jgi:choline-glycine betaine transporter
MKLKTVSSWLEEHKDRTMFHLTWAIYWRMIVGAFLVGVAYGILEWF